jgi:hypothetical protein
MRNMLLAGPQLRSVADNEVERLGKGIAKVVPKLACVRRSPRFRQSAGRPPRDLRSPSFAERQRAHSRLARAPLATSLLRRRREGARRCRRASHRASGELVPVAFCVVGSSIAAPGEVSRGTVARTSASVDIRVGGVAPADAAPSARTTATEGASPAAPRSGGPGARGPRRRRGAPCGRTLQPHSLSRVSKLVRHAIKNPPWKRHMRTDHDLRQFRYRSHLHMTRVTLHTNR